MQYQGVLSRRNFLGLLLPVAIVKPISQHPTPNSQQSVKPLQGVSQPEFWFGEQVEFKWVDEGGKEQAERGEVCGVVWNFLEVRWEFQVMWVSSTVYPASDYPIFDGDFKKAKELHKVRSAQ